MVESLFLFIVNIIGLGLSLSVLGIITGFSPTLSITQLGYSATTKKAASAVLAIMIGVASAAILLLFLFQIFHPSVVATTIQSSTDALLVSTGFHILVGLGLLVGGAVALFRLYTKPVSKKAAKAKAKFGALLSLGFMRTFFSVSGVGAALLASSLIVSAEPLLVQLIGAVVFIAMTVLPFAIIYVLLRKNPQRVEVVFTKIKTTLYSHSIKKSVAFVSIGAGVALVIGATLAYL